MRPRPLPVVVAFAVALLGVGPPAAAPTAKAVATRPRAGVARSVTLLTGDKVVVRDGTAGHQGISVVPARRAGGPPPGFLTSRAGGHLHVIPGDVASLVGGLLDPDLFDVTQLVREGFDDRKVSALPVIVQRSGSDQPPAGLGARAAGQTRALDSVGGFAMRLRKDAGLTPVLADLARAGRAGGRRPAGSGPLAGVTRIWLDHKVRATALDPNLTQIGAPSAWKAGATGKGVRVAVLDTGIDASHPDLAGKVVAEANFSDAASTTDKFGHGTHVASIIAGTGARARGARRGVAFDASLLNGKVLDDFGSGLESWILAGMQWAAEQQKAKVVNMSLGSFLPSDGRDPMSVAVDRLTARFGTLFVVAAGNSGPDATTIGSPGAASSALTVGAVDVHDRLAFFSSRGPRAGDFALKPDLTAPGVDIVAARAAGTDLGPRVGQWYTRLSGTSMATPHTAGAAADLAQEHPDWPPAKLKAALMATAVPRAGLSPYSQGAGRLDVGHAVSQQVTADQASLDFGYFRWPHTHDRPVTRKLTWHNPLARTVTLKLALDLRDPAGKPAAAGVASLSAASVTVPSGGSASVSLTLDVRKAALGLYGGYLVANGGSLRTPVAFYNEPERYDLVLRGTGRTGRPPTEGLVTVLNLDTGEVPGSFFGLTFLDEGGRATLRVPPGAYSVMSTLLDIDEHDNWLSLSVAGDPQVTVRRDTTVRLDARKGRPLSNQVATKRTEPAFLLFEYSHQAAGNAVGSGFILFPWQVRWPVFMQPTEKVTKGTFTADSQWRLRPPLAAMEVLGPGAPALDPLVPAFATELDGRREVALVDVGQGRPEDYAGKDVAGMLALVHRSDLDFTTVVRNATNAKAAMVVVANDAPGPFVEAVFDAGTIPSYTISGREGTALERRLARGPVTVRVTGNRHPAHVYDMLLLEPDRIPSSVAYRFSADDLARRFARVGTVVHSLNQDAEYEEGRMAWNPRTNSGFGLFYSQPVPLRRTDLVLAEGARWEQHVIVPVGDVFESLELSEPDVAYHGGQKLTNRWLRAPLRPGFPVVGKSCCPPLRDATHLQVSLDDFMDAERHTQWFGGFFIFDPKVRVATRFYRDGKLVKRVRDSFAELPVVRRAASYRLVRDVDASALLPLTARTQTVWSFRSKEPKRPWTPVRLMEVDWNLQVDEHNRALVPPVRTGPPLVRFRVRSVNGTSPVVISGLRFLASADDGRNWTEVKARHLGHGVYRAELPARLLKPGGYVSLQVRAQERGGGRVEQRIVRAYAVP